MIARIRLAMQYRAAGCPSPWKWAGDALRRERAEQDAKRTKTPPRPLRYGCRCCNFSGWFLMLDGPDRYKKCGCVRPGTNPDPLPHMVRPAPPPGPPPRN